MADTVGEGSNPQSHLQSSASSPVDRDRKSDKFRVYNRSRESFLSLEVSIFDTTAEPLKRLFDYLVRGADAGVWLKPYRGIPASQGAKFFDLVYLDEECRVMHDVDSYPNPKFTVLEIEPASALLLPPHTAFVSQINLGDQLEIRGTRELGGMLTEFSDSTGGESGTQNQGTGVRSLSSRTHRIPQRPTALQPDASEVDDSREEKESLGTRIWHWFFPKSESGHRSNRVPLPGLIAYHWSGGAPQAYHLGDLSKTGFYLLTDERPYPGTLILMTLQRTARDGEKLGDSIAVFAKVIRWGPDGVGFAFAPVESRETKIKSNRGADDESLNEFLKVFNLP